MSDESERRRGLRKLHLEGAKGSKDLKELSLRIFEPFEPSRLGPVNE